MPLCTIMTAYCLFLLLFLDLPGPIDNSKITVNKNGHLTLKQGNIPPFPPLLRLLLSYLTFILFCFIPIKMVVFNHCNHWNDLK